MINVRYSDVAVGSKEHCIVTANEKKSYVDLNNLNNDNFSIKQYGSNEWCRTLLDGSFNDLENPPINQVYISESLSDSDGIFANPIVITRTFSRQYSEPGITFIFDNGTDDCWCNHLNIKWYRSQEIISSMDFYPDTTYYFCENAVEAFDKIEITFYSTSKPYRFLRVTNIADGVERFFTKEELIGVKVFESISEAGDELSINTAEINLLSKSNVDFMFQRTQPIEIRLDNQLICKSFNESTERDIGHAYQINAEDYIGILDKETFIGGVYENYPLRTLLTDICADIPHDYVGPEVISGYLPIMSRREALQYVAFAKNKIIDCSRSRAIKVKEIGSTIKAIPDSRVMCYPHETSQSKVTKIVLSEHSLAKKNGYVELVNEVVNGTYTYTWDEPHYSYSITNGTIVESGANYCVINSNGRTVILEAKEYKDTIRELYVDNPLTVSTDLPNVVSKVDNRLVTADNSSSVLSHLADVYFRNVTLDATIIYADEQVGDKVSLSTGEKTVFGVIESMEIDLNTKLANLSILEVE